MARTSERRVLVFAKAPRPGQVKTRLIPLLGPDGAAALHARLIKHTLRTVRRSGMRNLELHGAPANDDFLRFCAAQYRAELVEQEGPDLGARMHHAAERALQTGGSILLIGTDCPVLSPRHLCEAAMVLDNGEDAVFVPTEDGGYALVGLRRAHAHLFEDVTWSSASVMEQTRERLRALAWRWRELDTLWDVDRPEDYARMCATTDG